MSEPIFESYILPASLVSRADMARLLREIETIDSAMESQKVRAGEHATEYHLPVMSQPLTEFLAQNDLDITRDQARLLMTEQLRKLKDKAPVVHMTFAVEADAASTQQLVAWMRANAHPHTLLSIGLQPALIAGVYLRTPNHIQDLSLKSLFSGKHDTLINELELLSKGPQVVPAPPQQPLESPYG